MQQDMLKEALLKKALGFETEEILEEYLPDDDGNAKLCKRKVTKKFNPPDISALKFLMEQAEFSQEEISNMTDKQLEDEMNRLLKLLTEKEKKL